MSNYFWYHLQINFDGTWSCEGPIYTHVFSLPIQAMHCVVWLGSKQPRENIRKAFTARHGQQRCLCKLLSVLLLVGVGSVFKCLCMLFRQVGR